MPHAGQGRSTEARARKQISPRISLRALGLGGLIALVLLVPLVRAATPNDVQPGQRVDLKVLLVSADGTEPGFGAWKAALDREGVPYDTLVAYNGQARAATLTDDARRLRQQPRQVPGRDPRQRRPRPQRHQPRRHDELPLGVHRRRMGGAREVRAHVRDPPAERLHGARAGARAERGRRSKQDGAVGTLTAAGKAAFPYLKGPVPIADDDADGRRGVRLRGHAGQRGGLADARSPDPGAARTSASTRTRTTGARRW